ncbi:TerD family protein [uncultured Ruminococcus sp.]|uniref:TerD family protein n=1 Tax=uncultured Ruminococcus sp. TaxID=165186 RepID=UPI0025FD5EBB|nr:TerD family protein [uncultured Ruminococcus sp.]
MEIMNTQYRCEFVSYKISEDVLAEIFAANGIMGASFESGYGVRVTETEDGIIFSCDGECGLPKLIFTAWGGDVCELSPEDASVLDGLKCEPMASGREDCRSYRRAFSGSSADKMAFLAGLFSKTDIAARMEITEIRASKCGMTTDFGVFGLDKKCYVGGRLSGWQINIVGESGEGSAVLLLKDGALTVRDRGDAFRWNENALAAAVKFADQVDSPEGLTAVNEISCADVSRFEVPNSVLMIAGGAFAGCGRLQKVCIGKPNVLLENGFVNGGVVLAGPAGGCAEKYAAENGLGFEVMNVTEPAPFAFEIADGVWLAAAETSVYRKQDDERADLSDVFYMPEGRADDFDCEVLTFSEETARQSGVAAQLDGFGKLVQSETVRNDRNGYIKVSARRAANGAHGVSLEIEHDGKLIIMHTEQIDAGEKSENALFRRYLEIADSVAFGERPAADDLKKPDYSTGDSTAETVPETEVIEPVVETVPETEVIEPVTETVPETEVIEPIIETVPETEVIEPVVETAPETEVAEPVVETVPEAEVAEPVVETAPETEVIEPVAETAPEAEVIEPVIETVPEAEVAEPVAETAPEAEVAEPVAETAPEAEVAEPVAEAKSVKLVRGARFDLSAYNDKMLVIDMDYQAEQGIDIDGYIFLLAANGKVRSDADLVFFGQKASVDRAVNNHPTMTRCFTVELAKLDSDVSKLAVAFAIYGDKAEQVFSCVKKPVIHISCNGQEICSYELEGLKEEKSAVAVEMYNKNGWKLRTVGLGYKEALKTLCGSYGVEVNS